MAEAPVCRKCGVQHWRFKQCSTEPATARAPLFVARRPRDGYIEFGDRLFDETVRMGETTFARRREPGQRHGSLREPGGNA